MKRVKKLENKDFYRGCAFAHPLAYPKCSGKKRFNSHGVYLNKIFTKQNKCSIILPRYEIGGNVI